MKILLVCPYFPPENAIAAARTGKFAECWAEAGHDVTVVCREPVSDRMAAISHRRLKVIPVRDPLAAAWRNSNRVAAAPTPSSMGAALQRLKAVFKWSFWPDVFAPWALKAFLQRRNSEPFDVVVASVGPFSSLLLGYALARRDRTKLVIDYRDLMASGPYYTYGRLRRSVDRRLERYMARRAALVSGVSTPMVDDLRLLYDRPTVLTMNGYEPADFDGFAYRPASSVLRLVYCGQIYQGRRDPTVLFQAVRALLSEDPSVKVSIDFYGRNLAHVLDLAAQHGIRDVVRYLGEVTHGQSLQIQAEADLLLLLLWDDPREAGVLTGKLFEYIGARRPILMQGLDSGAAADLIRENDLGLVSNDPAVVGRYLRQAAREKSLSGRLDAPRAPSQGAFTRRAESLRLLSSISAVVQSRGDGPHGS